MAIPIFQNACLKHSILVGKILKDPVDVVYKTIRAFTAIIINNYNAK